LGLTIIAPRHAFSASVLYGGILSFMVPPLQRCRSRAASPRRTPCTAATSRSSCGQLGAWPYRAYRRHYTDSIHTDGPALLSPPCCGIGARTAWEAEGAAQEGPPASRLVRA